MRSFTCPSCAFVYLSEEAPETHCPACEKPWPQPAVLHEPVPLVAPLPVSEVTAGEALPPLVGPAWKPLALGLLVGGILAALLMFALRFRFVSVDAFPAYQTALAAQANTQQQLVTAETRIQELGEQLAAAQTDLESVKDRYTKDTAELASLREQKKEQEQLLFQLRLASAISFARSWLILGPYPQVDEQREQRLLAQAEPFQFDSAFDDKKWQRFDSPEDRINLAQGFNHRDVAIGYAVCWVYADVESDVLLSLGSDDGIVVWVNRLPVHKNVTNRSASANQDQATCRLKQGWNEVLTRVDNLGTGDWALYCEFRTPGTATPLKLFSTNRPPVPVVTPLQ